MPGVRAVFHRGNIGEIFRSTPASGFDRVCEERRPPFEDDGIRYYGQYIALAVAGTFEAAERARHFEVFGVGMSNGLPFSSRHYVECLKVGAEKFGWSKHNPATGSSSSRISGFLI